MSERMGSQEELNEKDGSVRQSEDDRDLEELIALLRKLGPGQKQMVYGFIKGFLIGTETVELKKMR